MLSSKPKCPLTPTTSDPRPDPGRGRAAQVRAARGWPEKTNPGDGDRKSVDGRNLARRTGYRLDQPPPETR
uniref:Uncharacterized protein n=1 Tax=Oryza meridionalis TaxID=40149 RepID=A0A0E0BX15_9ORYZ